MSTTMMGRRVRCRALALAGLGAVVGCGNDDGSTATSPGAGTGPLYLVATYFSAGDNETTYFVTSHSFDESTRIDSTDGPALLGGVVPSVWNGAVFAPDSTAPVVTRYDIGPDDRLQRGSELSFAGVGMTQLISWHVYIASDTEAIVFDPIGLRFILWDPSRMVLTGEQVALPMLQRPGWVPNLVFEHSGVVRRGDTLLIPLGWQDQDGNSMYTSAVLAFDLATKQVISVSEDARCGETYAALPTPSGELYFMPPDWSALPHYVADLHQPTCVSRIAPGATEFDAGNVLDVSALGGGLASAGAVPDRGSGFFFTSLDRELWEEGSEADAVWRVWHHDFQSNSSRQVESLPLWAGQTYFVDVGDERFIPYWESGDAGSQTTLYRVPQDGTDPTPLFSFEGSWYGASRLR